jgi:ATP-dependent Clp protease ATP-binding subunit ClpC
MPQTLALTGTKAFAAGLMRRIFFHAFSFGLYTLALLPFIWTFVTKGDALPLLVSLLLLAFFLHVVHLFLHEKFESDTRPLGAGESIAASMSHELLKRLWNKKVIKASDILTAAVETGRGKFLLQEMGLDAKTVLSRCISSVDLVEPAGFLRDGVSRLAAYGETRVDANLVLALFFEYVPACTSLLQEVDLSPEDVPGLLKWETIHHHFKQKNHSWSAEHLRRSGAIGRSWVMGYTSALDELTVDLGEESELAGERTVIVHRPQIEDTMRVLSRATQRNILFVGPSGVGKRTLVSNLAHTLRDIERAKHLPYTRVLQVRTERLLSGVKDPDAFLLKAIAAAQEAGKFVLVFKDLALFLHSASPTLKNVFMRCLESKNFAVIGIAAAEEYHGVIKIDPSLDSQFEKIEIPDTADDETFDVLMAHYFHLAKKTHIQMTYKALKSILELSKRYLANKGGFPGKALAVMDDAVMRAKEQGDKFVREDHVREVVSLKGKVNVQRVSEGEKERLLTLEDTLKNKIIGQDAAVRAVVSSLKRARLDLGERKKPIGTFLFLGPTGVGKTQTAKVLAQEYFGSADAMVRLDMNEFSHEDSLFGIIGGGPSGSKEGFLSQRVQDKPFSLILLDEIEKAHKTVLNLFLQILDEGFLNDNRGVRTDFRNTIIIATSNAGALFLRDFLKANPQFEKDLFKTQLIETILKDRLFTPEFINRFDEVVVFYPLAKEHAMTVGGLMVQDIVSEVQRKRGITVTVEPDVLAELVNRGYSGDFGAREMRRTIADKVEDFLADHFLRTEVKRGDTIVINMANMKW